MRIENAMTEQFSRAGRWLLRYTHLLVKLHQLTARNIDESDEADALRDEMDLPWRRMTPEELRMARDLSADLYSITDPPPPAVESSPPKLDALVTRAVKDEDWIRVLQVVRENAAQIPLYAASFLRGFAWSQLGLHEAGAEFFMHAVKLRPERHDYRSYVLDSLVYAGRERDALPYAEQWIEDATDRLLLLAAANVLFINAESSTPEEARRLHGRAIDVAERALHDLDFAQLEPDMRHLAVNAFLHIAMSQAYLGDLSKAHAAWQRASVLDPNSLDTLLVRSVLIGPQDELGPMARQNVARSLVGVPPEQSSETRLPLQSFHNGNTVLGTFVD